MGNGARAQHAVPLRKTLSQLSDKGWLFTREALGKTLRQAQGKTRFYIRDAATHQYAFEKLRDSAEWEERILAHAKYFAELIEREGERLRGHGQLEALKILGVELENIYEALDTCLKRVGAVQEPPTAGAQHVVPSITGNGARARHAVPLLPFAKHLESYLSLVGRWQEGLLWYERILKKTSSSESGSLKAHGLLCLGWMLFRMGDYSGAEDRSEEALCAFRETGDRWGIAMSLNNLGAVAYAQGRYEEAEKLHQESLQIKREIGDPWGIAGSLINLGNVAYVQGRYDKAERLYREGRKTKEEIGDLSGTADSIINLGWAAKAQGRLDKAEKLWQKSLKIKREIGDPWGIANSLNSLGNLAYDEERYEEAEKLWQESLKISREIGARSETTLCLTNLGVLAYDEERYGEAEKLHYESLKIEREIGDRRGTANSLGNLGDVSIKVGHFADACEYLEEALRIGSELGSQPLTISTLITSGYLLAMTDRLSESAMLLFGAERQAKEMNYKLGPMEQNELDEGMAKLKEALSEDDLAEARASAEKMSLEELTEFALEVLKGLDL